MGELLALHKFTQSNHSADITFANLSRRFKGSILGAFSPKKITYDHEDTQSCTPPQFFDISTDSDASIDTGVDGIMIVYQITSTSGMC